MLRHIFTLLRRHWEYVVLMLTLLVLALVVTGNDIFEHNPLLVTLLAVGGTLTTSVLTFLFAFLIIPLLMLIGGFVSALLAAGSFLVTLVVGSLFTPVLAFFSGLASTLLTWLAGTWLGTLLSPLYSLASPVLLKIASFLGLAQNTRKLYRWAEKNSFFGVIKRRRRYSSLTGRKGRSRATPARAKRAQSK